MSINRNFVANVRTSLLSRRSHPAQHGETFDGPPTLERSGSEHRVGRFPSSSLRGEDRDERWSSLWLKGDGGIRKMPFLMGKSDANECNESCFQIAECSSLYQQRRTG